MPVGVLPARFCPWDGTPYGDRDLCCRVCGSERAQATYGGIVDLQDLAYDRRREGPRWQKILYERQAFPDNYTDHTFLRGLKRNANIRTYDYWTLVYDSSAVVQQISIVTLFIMMFMGFYDHGMGLALSAESITVMQATLLALGYSVQAYCTWSEEEEGQNSEVKEELREGVEGPPLAGAEASEAASDGEVEPEQPGSSAKAERTIGAQQLFVSNLSSLIVLVGVLLALSPVLATLTNSFSDDTIWVLTILLMLIHVVFHDYGYIIGSSEKFEGPVSLNAAIFASVLLGSRLPSNLHVFTLIFLAIELFALFPIMRHHLRKVSMEAHLWLTLGMFLLGTVLITPISSAAAFCYVFLNLFITFGSPYWLIWVQKYKKYAGISLRCPRAHRALTVGSEINGPWDEAIPSSADGYYNPQQD